MFRLWDQDLTWRIQQHVHATILAISNDSSLVLKQQTPLEINHAAFLMSFAHQAHLTMSLRLLDTGTARDVSGVIRISVGAAEAAKWDVQMEAKELLYFVAGDGNVRVFERGQ
jgi:elongator complex protein 6